MPCRNEDWVIGCSARAVLEWVDHLVVLNHASTDKSGEILFRLAEEHPGRITVLNEPDPLWAEMAHRQRMLDVAREYSPSHIVMVDADEVLTSNLVREIRGMIQRAGVRQITQLPWICLAGGLDRWHNSGIWSEQYVSMAFSDAPYCYWQARETYDFHHRHPMGTPCIPYRPVTSFRLGGLMHLQFVNRRRLKAKQYLYQLTERLRWPGRESVREVRERYSLAVYGSLGSVAETPMDLWWGGYARELLAQLHLDAEPWQEAECRRLLAAHPGIGEGLDSFGVV